MNPEPDPVAVDLICRLTKAYSDSLWRHEKGMCEYTSDRQYCSSCLVTRFAGDTPIHSEGCKGVKLLIAALNYVAPFAELNPYAKR